MDRRRNGFSLIELIIAIAILVILTGLLAPQFLKYIEKSRKAVCMHAMDSLREEYVVGLVEADGLDGDVALAVLDRVMTGHGGERTKSSDGEEVKGHEIYSYFTGLCKSGGEYQCEFIADLAGVVIRCSRHGELEIDIKTLKARLESISFDELDIKTLGFSSVGGYFTSSRKSIDSEAVSTGAAYKPYDSLADFLGKKLLEQGINVQGKSWRLHKEGKTTYALYLTDKKITKRDSEGKEFIDCTKYDISGEKVIRGKVQIGMDKTSGKEEYPIINGSSFREEK